MKTKKCGIVLPYFGKFGNYFQLFLNSCGYNKEYEWLVFTDDMTEYIYPYNVKRIPFTLDGVKRLAENKMDLSISLESPYKLCDFKPAYGLIFEDYLSDYKYWGHCDCDLIFGNLDEFLASIFEKEYDKIFTSGHLILYKNTIENCRLFMSEYRGEFIYIDAFHTNRIYVFDEDYLGKMNPERKNVHSIFLDSGKTVYTKDLSFNVAVDCGVFKKVTYISDKRKYETEEYTPRRYYWCKGKIVSVEKDVGMIRRKEYLYIHLQKRYMRFKNNMDVDVVEILPDRFKSVKKIPENVSEFKTSTIRFTYLYWFDQYRDKLKKKTKSLIINRKMKGVKR